MSRIAMAIASTTAMMAMISNMANSLFVNCQGGKSTPPGYQVAQGPVAEPQPAPHHQAQIEPEQRVGEQRAADPHMRRHRAAEVASQQDRAQDRGRRDRIEDGAGDGNDAEGSRETFARTIAHPVHRFRDDRPWHQLDRAVEQHEYDDEAAEKTAGPKRGPGDRRGLNDRR